ncbi:MAG: 2,3-diphosphoglycerate-dependent phosphoglycerate mutase [Bacteroidales bacterium]
MYTLILVRHGESVWNKENRFTGWTDVDLSEKGAHEAYTAGRKIKESGLQVNVIYTSVLKRAIKTAFYIADECDILWVKMKKHWRLNERHYGALQGLNKADTTEKYGEEQVKIWRRSYNILPPLLSPDDKRCATNDPQYKNLDPGIIPLGESLELTIKRVLPFWEDHIVPSLKKRKVVLVVAHGNSLRGLIKHLDGVSDQDIVNLEIPTGKPLVYELDKNLKPTKHYYL